MKIDKRMLAVRHAAASYNGRFRLAAVRLEKGAAFATDGRLAASIPQRPDDIEANPPPIMIHRADCEFAYREADEDDLFLHRDVDDHVYIDEITEDRHGFHDQEPVHVAHACDGEYPDTNYMLTIGQSPERAGPWTYIDLDVLQRMMAILRESVGRHRTVVAIRIYESQEEMDPGVFVMRFQLDDGRVGKLLASPCKITDRNYAPLREAISKEDDKCRS